MMEQKNGKIRVTTTLPPTLFHAIKVQAAKEKRTLSDIFEELVTAYLEKAETS